MNKSISSGLIAFAAATLSFTSCDKGDGIIRNFPVDKQLKAEAMPNTDSLINTFAIFSGKDHYVFLQARQENGHAFKVCDKNFNVTGEIAPFGNGHDEWLSPVSMGQIVNDGNAESLYVLEGANQKYYKLPLAGGPRVEVADMTLPDSPTARNVFEVRPDYYIGTLNDDNESCTFTFDKKAGKVNTLKEPEYDFGMKSREMAFRFMQKLVSYNADKQKMVAAYFAFPLIVVRDTDGNITTSVRIGEDWPKYTEDMRDNGYFRDIKTDEDNIYVLFNDPKLPEETSILVLEWDGTPVARYHVNKSIAFAVDGAAKKIFCINADDSHGKMSSYTYE